jgi:hypothetical protein
MEPVTRVAGFEGSARRRNGKVDIGFFTGWCICDGLLGCRVLDGKGLDAFRGDPFPIDEELEFLGQKFRCLCADRWLLDGYGHVALLIV